MIAALYVETDGCYFDQAGVDPWDEARDAREYIGPHPVVAHPPCQRWGRFWHGSTRKPHQYQLGGVLEHPADSRAWSHFGLTPPRRHSGWQRADMHDGWTCYVEQGHYGHASRKPTWLYVHGIDKPDLQFGPGQQRLPQWMIDRYGYEKARRIGVVAMVGGKDKTKIRNATPHQFRDLLLSMARTVKPRRIAA